MKGSKLIRFVSTYVASVSSEVGFVLHLEMQT
jgi:hypothetical protein